MSDVTQVLLSPGDRIRSKQHPELTGTIKHYEYRQRGALSDIPYNVAWDEDARAYDLLGWLWIYASDGSVERITEEA